MKKIFNAITCYGKHASVFVDESKDWSEVDGDFYRIVMRIDDAAEHEIEECDDGYESEEAAIDGAFVIFPDNDA